MIKFYELFNILYFKIKDVLNYEMLFLCLLYFYLVVKLVYKNFII